MTLEHPLLPQLVLSTFPGQVQSALLKSGGTSPCYDGQYYFDTDHPSVDAAGNTVAVSNMDLSGGANPVAWSLLDTSRPIKR